MPSTETTNETDQALLLTSDGTWNPHKIAYFEMEDIMLKFGEKMVEKNNSVIIMMSGRGRS